MFPSVAEMLKSNVEQSERSKDAYAVWEIRASKTRHLPSATGSHHNMFITPPPADIP